MHSKSWYHITFGLHYPMPGVAESHFVCTQSAEDMAAARKSTTGHHFGGIVWAGPGGRDTFEQRQGVYALGHIHKNAVIHNDVADALAGYGVARGDGLRDALEKVIAKCGIHELALGEM